MLASYMYPIWTFEIKRWSLMFECGTSSLPVESCSHVVSEGTRTMGLSMGLNLQSLLCNFSVLTLPFPMGSKYFSRMNKVHRLWYLVSRPLIVHFIPHVNISDFNSEKNNTS